MTKQINEENIRVAAYYIWQNAGCPQGAEQDCWMKACEQLFSTSTKSVKKTTSKKVAVKSSASSLKSSSSSVVKSEAKPVVKTTVKKTSTKKVTKPVASAEPFYGIRK
jgi:hypothetical protein